MEQYVNEIKNGLNPTPNQIAQMKQNILKNGGKQVEKRAHKRKAWLIPLAASIALVFSLTAFAAVVQGNRSTTLYHWSASDMAQNLDISSSNAGYTITANIIFGDEAHSYILFTLTRDDGGVLHLNIESERADICFGKVTAQNDSDDVFYSKQPIFILEDQDPKDNEITFGTTLWNTDDQSRFTSVIGTTIELTFSGLYTGGVGDIWGFNAENSAAWNLTIPAEYRSIGTQHLTNIKFDYQGKEISLNTITVSPLDISFVFTGNEDDLYAISTDAFYYNGRPFTLILENGEELGFDGSTGGHGRLTTNLNLLEYGPIEVGEIAALQIAGDVTIPISLAQ